MLRRGSPRHDFTTPQRVTEQVLRGAGHARRYGACDLIYQIASPSGPAGGACGSIWRARHIAEVGCRHECAPGIWSFPPNRSHHTLGFVCCRRRRPAMNRVVVALLLASLPLKWAHAQGVGSVTAKDFVQTPPRDIASLVAGKIPGLIVNTPSGDPAAGTEVLLRGFGTLNASTSPLVLVDGVPGDLKTVAPQDVASIDVLKDASAAAIYGSRASNGVILITTKRQDSDRPVLRYDSYTSIQSIYKMPDFLTAADVERLAADSFKTPAGNTFTDLGYATDWRRVVMRGTPISYNQNVSEMGGAPGATDCTAAFAYQNDEGQCRMSS